MTTTEPKQTTLECNKRLQSATAGAQAADRTAETARKAVRLAKMRYKIAKQAFKKARKDAKKAAKKAKRARKEYKASLEHKGAETSGKTPKKALARIRNPRRAIIKAAASTPAAANIVIAQPEAATEAPDSSKTDA